jgi:hypothetical protein
MSKRFTLAEAQGLIPKVERLLRNAIDRKSEFDEAERALQSFTERAMMLGGVLVDRVRAFELRNRREAAVAHLREAIEEIQRLGCVVKDLDMGLVDFPTLLRGQEVYLCWKLGEPSIGFWHGVDEGFRGRKAIDQDFRDHHKGDRAQ